MYVLNFYLPLRTLYSWIATRLSSNEMFILCLFFRDYIDRIFSHLTRFFTLSPTHIPIILPPNSHAVQIATPIDHNPKYTSSSPSSQGRSPKGHRRTILLCDGNQRDTHFADRVYLLDSYTTLENDYMCTPTGQFWYRLAASYPPYIRAVRRMQKPRLVHRPPYTHKTVQHCCCTDPVNFGRPPHKTCQQSVI